MFNARLYKLCVEIIKAIPQLVWNAQTRTSAATGNLGQERKYSGVDTTCDEDVLPKSGCHYTRGAASNRHSAASNGSPLLLRFVGAV